MVAGIGLPIELKDQSITMGAVVKSYYLLPNNSTYYTHPTITLARKKRDVSSSRWRIYEAIVNFFTRFDFVTSITSNVYIIAKFDYKIGQMLKCIFSLL